MMHRHTLSSFLLLALLLAPPTSVAAQETGTITGTVVDATTGDPIEGATVRVTGTAYGQVSRANGTFAILRVPPGIYGVEASAGGYGTVRFSNVDVRTDVNRVLQFTLEASGQANDAAAARSAANAAFLAQQSMQQPTEVRLFRLQHLSNADAAKLVAPFVRLPVEGVFDPGNAVRGVTVRAATPTLARIDSLLTAHDRPPVTIVLRFQVIAALDSAVRDPQISNELHSALREELPFAGYRALAQTLVSSTPGDMFTLVMNGAVDQMRLSGELKSVGTRTTAAGRGAEVLSASLTVALRGLVQQTQGVSSWEPLVTTSLSIPIGQTVVIGNATARSPTAPQHKALILVVRAEAR